MIKSAEAAGLYCVGHALVDYEIKVEDRYLDHHSIKKGQMTLVDEAAFRYHLEKNLSHLVVDRAGGGSAVNSLVTYVRLGGTGSLCCQLAADDGGDFFKQELVNLGIAVINGRGGQNGQSGQNGRDGQNERGGENGRGGQNGRGGENGRDEPASPATASGAAPAAGPAETTGPKEPTGRCLVLITPDAERTMLTHPGINQRLNSPANLTAALATGALFYGESYLVSGDAQFECLMEHLRACRELNIRTSVSMSDVSMVVHFRQRMIAILDSEPDILFGNREEFGEYTGQKDPDEMAGKLDGKVNTLVLTDGKHGSFVYHAGKKTNVPALRTAATDTLGAGDAYAGAFLYAMQERGCEPAAAAEFAAAAAGQVVSRFGPRLNMTECQELISQFFPSS